MSKYRERADKIKAAGEAKRGNFEPSGAPKRVYDYWLKRSKTWHARDIRAGVKKENFCHFWRVVFIWAPLMRIGRAVGGFETAFFVLLGTAGVLLITGGLVVFVIEEGFLALLLGALGLAAALAALVVLVLGIHWFIQKFPKASENAGWALLVTAVLAGFYGFGAALFGAVWGLTVPLAVVVFTLLLWFKADDISGWIEGRRIVREEEEHAARLAGPVVEKEPGKISKFFSGLGDFVILIAQVARVNKWKICPTVEINKSS